MTVRNTKGQFGPGNNGNPGGRPKGLARMLRDQFGDDAPKILEVFRDLALGRVPVGYESVEIKTSDRIKAGVEVLDRLMGKALQAVELDAEVGIPAIHAQVLAALQLTPHERRQRLAATPSDADEVESDDEH